ncbi:MAG: ABC transporter permease [Candidatus Saccharimonadales bacterium]
MSNLYVYIIIALVAFAAFQLGRRLMRTKKSTAEMIQTSVSAQPAKLPLTAWQRPLYTVWMFFLINTRRVFRDRVALFFTFLFPLIFLFIFGGLFGSNQSTTFSVAIINNSHSAFSKQFVAQASKQKTLKVDNSVKTLAQANDKMSRGELDATIQLPASFGVIQPGKSYPTGQAIVHYTENNQQAAETLASVLQAEFQGINASFIKPITPFTVTTKQTNTLSLSQFDYTFTGLLGFAILGSGIFGPINVFPELKKMGILRRLHTTPLRVWQYFLSTMLGYAFIGFLSLALMFVVAMIVFHLRVIGNYFELAAFLVFGIVMVLGIGLALGGWAKNERQVAPLANIIVFPMMFLTGVFFPRYLMPDWLQGITTYMPLTPVIDGARLIATEGKSLIDIAPQLDVMAVWTVIVYAIAFRLFRWE